MPVVGVNSHYLGPLLIIVLECKSYKTREINQSVGETESVHSVDHNSSN